MRVLVTGGAGFIGSHFVRLALRAGHEVTNLDALTYAGYLPNLTDVEGHSAYHFIKGDICDPELADETVPRHDAVVNFAAESHVDRSIVSPAPFVRTNVMGTGVLLDAARRHGALRFLQVSTDEVYGSRDEGSFREGDALNPSSPYSASKAAADLLARAFATTHDLPVLITRSANAFGPNQFPEKLIPLAVTNLLEGRPVPLYGDGMNVRDWTYVEDICEAILLVLERGVPGEIYNIAAGNEMPNRALVELIVGLLGKGASDITPVADRPGHDRRYSMDSARLRSLGWEPRGSFEDLLARTVEWYKMNRAWWEPLKGRA